MKSQKLQVKIKHALDKIFAFILLILLSPLYAFIALLIKLDDKGPVFFKHERPGLHEKLFTIWKFRTMVVNADSLLDKDGRVSNVNRITRIGKFLRRLSLDELPQLINIIKGDMSFIGPRPAIVEHLNRYSQWQKKRFYMKPGVTGLAQVNGRNTLPWSKRIEYDIYYINNYSLWLDIKIFLKTLKIVILGENIILDRMPEQVDDLGIKIEEKNKYYN